VKSKGSGNLPPPLRNGSTRKEAKLEDGAPLKIRRPFMGNRDRYGRATKPGKTVEPPKKNKERRFPVAPPGYPWGVKSWLKRKEIWFEYGLCPRTVRRLEKRGFLHPRVIIREYFYERAEIEMALRDSRLLERDQEGGAQ
jgi:hypothetical protein